MQQQAPWVQSCDEPQLRMQRHGKRWVEARTGAYRGGGMRLEIMVAGEGQTAVAVGGAVLPWGVALSGVGYPAA